MEGVSPAHRGPIRTMMNKGYTALTLHTTMKTMNQLCDQLVADMTEAQEASALLTGQDSFDTVKDAKPLAAKAGQFNGKATLAWRRGNDWLTFTFRKDEDCQSGWAIHVRWLAAKPAWVLTPERAAKEKLVPVWVPAHLAAAIRQHLGTLANQEATQ